MTSIRLLLDGKILSAQIFDSSSVIQYLVKIVMAPQENVFNHFY